MSDIAKDSLRRDSSLKTRILSALVLGPVALGLVVLGGWFYLAMLIAAGALAFMEWCHMADKVQMKIPLAFAGLVYLSIAGMALAFLRMGFENGLLLTISVMVAVYASDTGAYFVGKTVGGPKMTPRLSPKKTWSGLGGAVFFGGLGLTLCSLAGEVGAHPAAVFVTGCVLGVTGQAGDLLVSAVKRKAGVKDTGHLIPGHGGILDRIDSLLLVAPVYMLIVWLWLN